MANRVIRSGILTSDKVCSLSWTAEIFYRRLMSVADDFGRFDARPAIVRSSLYPLQLDKVSQLDVVKWMSECSEAGLVRLYFVKEKPYMEILDFGQTLRIKKSKYPEPDMQMQADASRCIADDEQMDGTRVSEKNPNPNQETEIENIIIIAGERFLKKGSEIWMDEYRNSLNAHMLGKCRGLSEKKLLDAFDLEYPNYTFRDANHFNNSLKYVGEKLLKEKGFAKKESKSEIQDITWNP